MLFFFGLISLAITLFLAVQASTLLVQVIAFSTRPNVSVKKLNENISVAIVIPAHNEEVHIARALSSLRGQLAAGDKIIVVADNCTDHTAEIARSTSSTVLERYDAERRGKGYALDHAVKFLLAGEPFDVVVFLDADCVISPDGVKHLADCSFRTDCPSQASYLMRAPSPSPLSRIREFAFVVKNHVRPLGGARLGMPAPITGSGFALPWKLLQRLEFGNSHFAEDLKLGLECGYLGNHPAFCAEAEVASEFPSNDSALKTQSDRWQTGQLSLLRTELPKLFRHGIRKRQLIFLKVALDLFVPPLVILFLATIASFAVSLLLSVASSKYGFVLVGVIPFLILFSAIFLAWLSAGTTIVRLSDVAAVPLFVFGKAKQIPRAVSGRMEFWKRTDRH